MEYINTFEEPLRYLKTPKYDYWKLHGCNGGSWEAAIHNLRGGNPSNTSVMPLGMGTYNNCDIGFIKLNEAQFKTEGALKTPALNRTERSERRYIGLYKYIKQFLDASPVAAAMIIPGCFGGVLDTRGGAGGVCDRDGGCRSDL